MSRVEYKVEHIRWQEEGSHLDELVERANEWAHDGWRIASVDLTPHASFETNTLPVLLERDVSE